MDDVRILAPPHVIRIAADFMLQHCPPPSAANVTPSEPYHFQMNDTKSGLYSQMGPGFFAQALPSASYDFKRHPEGVKCLGSFIGSDAFVEQSCLDVVESWKPRFDAVVALAERHAQDALILLRSCLCSSIGHMLRTTPPRLIMKAALEFDSMVEKAFLGIAKLPSLTPEEWNQVHAPLVFGGFGLARAATTAADAYIGSLSLTLADLTTLDSNFWPAAVKGAFTNLESTPNPCPTQKDIKDAYAQAEVAYNRAISEQDQLRIRLDGIPNVLINSLPNIPQHPWRPALSPPSMT